MNQFARRNNIFGRTNNFNNGWNFNFNNNKWNNRNNNNNNVNNVPSKSLLPSFISELFKEDKKGIKLFRVCIKNNFQGLTHLFITRGYGLMKAVEDSFYEGKFNLAMKLLLRSPYNKTYQLYLYIFIL